MSSTIFNAPQYDPARERRRRNATITIILTLALVAALAWMLRFWPYEHVVDRFFTALENKNYETAYGIWIADAQWKQHPDKYKNYPFGEFYADWGPSGEWGEIKSYKIEGAGAPRGGSSGVVVEVTVNQRVDPKARIWVEKRDNSLTFSPY